ncbi:MAG: extracellular solute-binding protein [Pseudomonadota bacterium]
MMKDELIEAIELLERLRDLGTLWFDEAQPDALMNMSLYVMKRHLTGQMVTPTSLAQAAGVPYTTATRRVAKMMEAGLLDTRARTKTGRTVSLHPSPKLILQMVSYLMAFRTAVGQTTIPKGISDTRTPSLDEPTFIPPPSLARGSQGFKTGLSVLAPDDPAYSISKRLRRELSYLMGGSVHFAGASIDGLRARILANAQKAVSDYDVVAVDLPLIAEFAARGVLMPLDTVAASAPLNSADFISAAWRGTISNAKQYAIPILINPQLLFYRTDLFDKHGLRAPADTAELLRAARALHDPVSGVCGITWTAARGGPCGQSFIQFLADHGQPVYHLERAIDGYKTSHLDPRALKPAIDTPRGHATARFMLELLKVSPPGVLDLNWGGQVDLLREGRAAMAYEWASRAAQLVSARSMRDIEFLPHPVGVFQDDDRQRNHIAPIGGFAFGIPANIDPARVQTAWSAIEWLSSPEVIKLLVQHGGYVTPRHSVGSDPDVRAISPMIGAVERMARDGQIRLWPRPPVPSYAAMVEILGEEIHDMLAGVRSVAEALARAQDRADAIHRTEQRDGAVHPGTPPGALDGLSQDATP